MTIRHTFGVVLMVLISTVCHGAGQAEKNAPASSPGIKADPPPIVAAQSQKMSWEQKVNSWVGERVVLVASSEYFTGLRKPNENSDMGLKKGHLLNYVGRSGTVLKTRVGSNDGADVLVSVRQETPVF